MISFDDIAFVPLVGDAELSAKRLIARAQGRPLTERLWRRIHLAATAEGVTLTLGDVDESTISGIEQFTTATNVVSHRLSWADTAVDGPCSTLLEHEQVVVYRQALSMLVSFRHHLPAMRKLLND